MPDATVAGRFWLDQNADWQQDADEPGGEGVLVEMLADDAVVASGYDHFTYRASAAGLVSLQPAQVNVAVMKLDLTIEGADAKTQVGYVPINANNDNGSKMFVSARVPASAGIPTVRDFASNKVLDAADPELKRVQITAFPGFPEGGYTLQLGTTGTAKIRLWEDAKKTRPIVLAFNPGQLFGPPMYTRETQPREFWGEGLEMSSMTADPNGGFQLSPDARITLMYSRPERIGPFAVPVVKASVTRGVVVTPVVKSFSLIPGIVAVVNDKVGNETISIGITTDRAGSTIPGEGPGVESLASVMYRNVPGGAGGGTLVQVAGYDGVKAIENGTQGVAAGAISIVNGETKYANMIFVNDNRVNASPELKIAGNPVTEILDAGARWPGGEPATPDYRGIVERKDLPDYTVLLRGNDTPRIPNWTEVAVPASIPIARGIQSVAIRFNFRLYLMWRFASPGGSTLFPLARLEWNVFSRATRGPDGLLAVAPAAAKITAGNSVIDHSTPGVLAAPDFNLHGMLRVR